MYPTIEEVDAATHIQICYWYRFLEPPGACALGKPNFEEMLANQIKVMIRIKERLDEFGGFTPVISKEIGWE